MGLKWTAADLRGIKPANREIWSLSAVSPKDVWSVGAYSGDLARLALHWDGKSWSSVNVPAPDPQETALYAVSAVSHNDVWAAGNWSQFEGLIMHWNGSKWSVSHEEHISNGFSDISATAANDAWAAGPGKLGSPGPGAVNPLHWNGKSWTPGPIKALATSITADRRDDVWAYVSHGTSPGSTFIHWNGKKSTTLKPPKAPTGVAQVLGLNATAPDDAWAVGAYGKDTFYEAFYPFRPARGGYSTLVDHWNEKTWTMAPSGLPHAGLRAIAGSPANGMWAVGETDSQGKPMPLVERYQKC